VSPNTLARATLSAPYFATGGRELGLRSETLDIAGRPCGSSGARVLRPMYEGRRHPVLARLHEVDPRLAIRQRQFVRVARRRRRPWVCGSGGGCRLCRCDEQDGGRTPFPSVKGNPSTSSNEITSRLSTTRCAMTAICARGQGIRFASALHFASALRDARRQSPVPPQAIDTTTPDGGWTCLASYVLLLWL
jgi:hypothetical protein